MRYDFTPGAERALQAAAAWTSANDCDGLQPAELFLGLLAEPECRAALVLAEHGIDEAAVRARWPALRPATNAGPARTGHFSQAVLTALETALEKLFEHPQPISLATEHVLLGLAGSPGEASQWLASRGLEAIALEANVHRWAGHQPGPLPCDFDEPAPPRRIDASVATDAMPLAAARMATLRIVDAAGNRAGEGLRVVEDFVRFALDDRHLAQSCKAMRRKLAELLSELPAEARLAARDSEGDVGARRESQPAEPRADAADVAAASFQRTEQALRSLEEYAKIDWPAAAVGFERLRYETYTLQRAVGLTRAAARQLAQTRLYVLVDGRSSQADFERLVASLIEAGVHAIQLRDKRLADGELLARARRLCALTLDTSCLAIINDRADLAALAHADGVHVGQEELCVREARSIVGPDMLVGKSTHSIEQARAAVLEGASYLGVGPTFPSQTKEFREFPGLALVEAVGAAIRLPAFAIGGISAANLPGVLAAGLGRVAVGSAIVDAPDPAAAAREFLAILNKAPL